MEHREERIRSRRDRKDPNPGIVAALAILPTGILGVHHWARGRSDKAQNFSIIAIGSYVLHRILGFIGGNSIADGACSHECKSSGVGSNLELITGSEGSSLSIEHSPFLFDRPREQDQKWYDLMETELQLVNLLSDISDLLWPWVPILLWMIAIWQGIRLFSGERNLARTQSLM